MAKKQLALPSSPPRAVPVSQRARGGAPAKNLKAAVQLCDPFTPLDPVEDEILRVDPTPARGVERLDRILRDIERSSGTATLHLLGGQIGCGKTTELLRLRKRLDDDGTTTLYLDIDTFLDLVDVDLEDILIALWHLVSQHGAGAPVLAAIWKEEVKSIATSLFLNLPDTLVSALQIMLSQLKLSTPEKKKQIRIGLVPLAQTLMDGLNKAFASMRVGGAEIVVLVDNLEKMTASSEHIARLYLDRLPLLRALDAHLIITVPLHLCYSDKGGSLIGRYGGEVVILPMIRVHQPQSRGGGDDEGGVRVMSELLEKRVDFDKLFEDGIEAARQVARLSGGCFRHALRLIRIAVNEHDSPPVTRAAIDVAASVVTADFERALPEAWIVHLKHVHEHNQFSESCPQEVKHAMLMHLFVLAYQNGDPWWDVHPLVLKCRKMGPARSHEQLN